MANKSGQTKCYMSLPLKAVRFGNVRPSWAEDDLYDRRCSFWLRDRIGFYPQYLYFGRDETMAAQFAGYCEQWRRWWHDYNSKGKLVKVQETKGKPRNRVLAVFTLDSLTDPVFIDDHDFVEIMNTVGNRWPYEGVRAEKGTFKRSWGRSRWLALEKSYPGHVAVLVPHYDLRQAVEFWVRNEQTKQELEAMGFQNVLVKRFPVRR